MGAFNWVEFEAECPVCKQTGLLRAQTHVASDYDGDDRGRFCHRVFRVGDRMFWWDEKDPKYKEWKDSNWMDPETTAKEYAKDASTECCYTYCTMCGSEDLFAVVHFQSLTVSKISQVGLESDYPELFGK